VRILLIHPHDIYSHVEPWTVRIQHLAREFALRGHEVKLVYFPLDFEPQDLRDRMHPDGYETLPMCRWRKKLLTNMSRMLPLAEWADVVHFQKCHSWATVPAIYAAYRAGRPLHYDWDDWELAIYRYNPPSITTGYFLALFEGLLPGMVNTISYASQSLREMALEQGFPAENLFDGHVGADTTRFHPGHDGQAVRQAHGLEGTVVMYLGQLHGAQYAELFLHAARYLNLMRADEQLQFVVVGHGGRFAELQELARQLGLADCVTFTGAIEHVKVPRYLAAADLVVACFEDNAQQRTKSPLKIAEYMACAKAIIASQVGEVPRMLGDAGLLVPPGDALAIASAVEQFLDDPDLARRLGAAARQRALDCYDWRVTASNMIEAYERAIWDHRRLGRGVLGRLRAFVHGNRDLAGILNRNGEVFCGPESVQLDLTDRCNNDCIGCWLHSPLVRDPGEPPLAELPFATVEKLLLELVELGCQQVYFSGGGEPTIHPHWLDAIELAKSLGLRVILNTHFNLLDGPMMMRLAATRIDLVIASIWAATGDVYAMTHPNKPAEAFDEVTENLAHFCRIKSPGTLVRTYNVISPANVGQIEAMVSYAARVGADQVEFAPTDTIPGKTDSLLLDEAQIAQALAACERLTRSDHHNSRGRRLVIYELEWFVGRLSSAGAPRGLYDQGTINPRGCYVGWTFARIHADGKVAPCLKCHRYPLGNVLTSSFRKIWTGAEQERFREVARNFQTSDPFFQLVGNDPEEPVGCYKSCDDRGRNWDAQRKLDHLSAPKKLLLKMTARRAL